MGLHPVENGMLVGCCEHIIFCKFFGRLLLQVALNKIAFTTTRSTMGKRLPTNDPLRKLGGKGMKNSFWPYSSISTIDCVCTNTVTCRVLYSARVPCRLPDASRVAIA